MARHGRGDQQLGLVGAAFINEMLQLAEGLAGGSRNREKARARVNRLMREVDKCIALAEQPFDASSAPETRTAE